MLLITSATLAQTNQRSDSSCGTLGFACGIVGSTTESTLKMIQCANRKDKAMLLHWLNSSNPQDKVHGYVGLYFMERDGNKLTRKEKRIMKHTRDLNLYVSYCEGCDIGNKEKLNILLSKEKLAEFYRYYIESN